MTGGKLDWTGSEDWIVNYPPRYWYNQKRRTDGTLNDELPEPKPTPRAGHEPMDYGPPKRNGLLILAAVTGALAIGAAILALFIIY